MTNKLINTAVGTIIAGTAFSTTSVYGKDTSHPNILILIVDDWGAYDLSLTGSKLYETKNIDLLAQESAVFTQGYAAYPRSVPSR